MPASIIAASHSLPPPSRWNNCSKARAHPIDKTALEVLNICAEQFGRGLAVLVDLLNPEVIVIGSIYCRLQLLLEPGMLRALRREALPQSMSACRVVPAGLAENVGDYAGLSVALHALEGK